MQQINTPINRDEEIGKKNLSTFFLENKNKNMNNKSYFKEDMTQYSPLKHIHNVNININNQININNNDIITINNNKSSILIRKNINISKQQIKKSGQKRDKNIPNNKKILISRNKQNSLDFNSLNSFLSGNSNYTNLKKNYLSKKTNPVNLLSSSNNSNIKNVKNTTIYLHNFDKNKINKNNSNYSYNNSNLGNYSSHIILLDNKRLKNSANSKKLIKPKDSINNTSFFKLKNNKKSNSKNKNINKNQKSKNPNNNNINNFNLDKKIMKKSSTYQILPK